MASTEEARELLESDDDDGESGVESFLTDDEVVAYQEGLEDDDFRQDEEPSTSAAGQQVTPPASPEEDKTSGGQPPTQEGGHGHKLPRTQSSPQSRSRSTCSHARSVSRGRSRTRSRSPIREQSQPVASASSWKTERDPDISPKPKRFVPARPPGHQLNSTSKYKPLDLFKLFFSNDAVLTICQNTNKQAAKNLAKGKRYVWTNINSQEFFRYVGLTFFFALVKLNRIQDYWKKNTIFSVPFPANVMPRDRYRVISWNIHMSDPEKDIENDTKKGTPDYDPLFRLKPLLDTIKHACKAFYHPRQNLLIDEKRMDTMSSTKPVKGKVIKSGFKLFALTDISNGYILDFSVYTGKSQFSSLAYDSVMSLIKPTYLGSGFHLYVDDFYTAPKLFKDLFSMNIGACGTYRDNRKDSPCIHSSPRGSIRWMRDGPLVFVKWMDTSEITVCSTIHPAFSGSTVQRRVRTQDGGWTLESIPCPTPVTEYNKHMEGVAKSDKLIQYYSAHKSLRWYRTLFFHFLDVAATNSYLLHKELCREKQDEPMSHRAFLEELTAELCGVTVALHSASAKSGHLPVPISKQTDASKRASYGRRTCLYCRKKRGVSLSTPWKCKECDVSLCLISDRNCFEAWHQ